MNHYQLLIPKTPNYTDLKALCYLYLFGNEVQVSHAHYTIDQTTGEPLQHIGDPALVDGDRGNELKFITVSAQTSFSLSNITNVNLHQIVYNSQFQNTFEGVDKPIVETGDLVVVTCKTNEPAKIADIESNLDDYMRFSNLNEDISSFIYIGVSNSAKSDFNDPFTGLTKLIIGQRNFERINEQLKQIV